MEIYLMQHGECLPKDVDPEQPLSPEGRKQLIENTKAIKKILSFSALITSNKLRAIETAEIVAKSLNFPTNKIVKTELVKPTAPVEDAIEFLKQYFSLPSLLLVGHMPSILNIASYLLTEGSKVNINFQRGGVARIDVDKLPTHEGRLMWYTPPDILKLIAGV